jgi:hypothetical protein
MGPWRAPCPCRSSGELGAHVAVELLVEGLTSSPQARGLLLERRRASCRSPSARARPCREADVLGALVGERRRSARRAASSSRAGRVPRRSTRRGARRSRGSWRRAWSSSTCEALALASCRAGGRPWPCRTCPRAWRAMVVSSRRWADRRARATRRRDLREVDLARGVGIELDVGEARECARPRSCSRGAPRWPRRRSARCRR